MDNTLKKSYIWNTIGSGLNSFNSLFYLIIVTRINGIREAGIFTFCFATASMLYIIATYSGRTYQVTETDKKIGDNEFIVHRLLSTTIMVVVALLFCVIKGYSAYKIIILLLLCLFRGTEAICDVFHGILQKNDRLDIVGKSLMVRSLLSILAFIAVDMISKNLILSCLSIIFVNIIVLIFIDMRFSNKLKAKTKKVDYNLVLKIFILGFFTFGFSFIANYLVNAPRYAIDSLMNEEFQTIFGIIVMPASVIMLVNQFIIQPVITTLKNYFESKNKEKFLKLIYKIIGITIVTGCLALLLAYFLGIPVLNFMYNIELNKYLNNLLLVIVGATIYTVTSVLSNSLIVLRKTKIQLLIYIVTSVFAFIISYKLVNSLGFNGATYGYLSTMILLSILYSIYFIITINNKELWKKEKK